MLHVQVQVFADEIIQLSPPTTVKKDIAFATSKELVVVAGNCTYIHWLYYPSQEYGLHFSVLVQDTAGDKLVDCTRHALETAAKFPSHSTAVHQG